MLVPRLVLLVVSSDVSSLVLVYTSMFVLVVFSDVSSLVLVCTKSTQVVNWSPSANMHPGVV